MRVEGLGIADTPGEFVTRPLGSFVLGYAGLEGDRHAGLTMKSGVRQKHLPAGTEIRNARQLSLVSVEECALIAGKLRLPRLDPLWLGANIVLGGCKGFTQLPHSGRLVFESGAVVVIDSDNDPCTKAGRAVARAVGGPEDLATRFVKAASGRRGLVGWVERPGLVRVGDGVTLVSR
jgi:MOSC domain-containing protein YiiM